MPIVSAVIVQLAISVAAGVLVGGTAWGAIAGLVVFAVTMGAGTVIDQGVASALLIAVAVALALLAPAAVAEPATGIAAGIGTGWCVSASCEWVLGIPLRKLGTLD